MSVVRQLGEGTTVHEKALEGAVARVPAWRSRAARYTAIVGGLTNQNWHVHIEGEPRSFFIKVPGEGTEQFVDRLTANEAARNAHALGIGPEVVFFDPADGLEVSTFLDGYRACTTTDFGDPVIQAEALACYRRFHAGPPLRQTKTIFDMIEEHLEQARTLGAAFPVDIFWLEHRYRQTKAAFMASGLDIVPCFNDPMPGNFLIGLDGPRPMRLVDYEFASNNERSYDLGVLFAEMFYEEELVEDLVERFCGAVRPGMVARVIVNRALADFKWASWAIVTRKLKDWDFDYQKYGAWKYMRARQVMGDPRWSAWLGMI